MQAFLQTQYRVVDETKRRTGNSRWAARARFKSRQDSLTGRKVYEGEGNRLLRPHFQVSTSSAQKSAGYSQTLS
jgi:hypothetical protein